MQKLKLLPTLKEKKRYLVYEVSQNIASHNEIVAQANSLLGVFEGAKAGLQLITFKNNKGIIRVSTKYADKLKLCLALIDTLAKPANPEKNQVSIKTIYLSGLLNKAKQKINT